MVPKRLLFLLKGGIVIHQAMQLVVPVYHSFMPPQYLIPWPLHQNHEIQPEGVRRRGFCKRMEKDLAGRATIAASKLDRWL
jgi:hypothetical protein